MIRDTPQNADYMPLAPLATQCSSNITHNQGKTKAPIVHEPLQSVNIINQNAHLQITFSIKNITVHKSHATLNHHRA